MASRNVHPIRAAFDATSHTMSGGAASQALNSEIAFAFKKLATTHTPVKDTLQNSGSRMTINRSSAMDHSTVNKHLAMDPFNPANFGALVGQKALSGTQACNVTDPTCLAAYTGTLAGSSARADQHMNGSVPYTFNPTQDAKDPAFNEIVDLSTPAACMDCSSVTNEDDFIKMCVADPNESYATMRFAQCSTKANKQINFDNGSRQPAKVDTRNNVSFNLTNATMVPTEQKPMTPANLNSGKVPKYAGPGPLAATSAMNDPLGNVKPAVGGFGNPVTMKL